MIVLTLKKRSGGDVVTIGEEVAREGDYAARRKPSGAWEVGVADATGGWLKVRSWVTAQGEIEQTQEPGGGQSPIL